MYASGITFTGVASVSPGAGNLGNADNGLSLSTVTSGNVVLGQNIGQALDPAQLLSAREIPLKTFSLDLLSAVDSFFKIDTSVSILKLYKGNSNITPFTLYTLQGLNPAPGSVFSNFQLQLDETFINPDGQRDAAMSLGYNYNGAGGKVNPNEAAFSTVLESHFVQVDPAGQFEWYLQSLAKNGNNDRIMFVVTQKGTGVTAIDYSADSVDWKNTVAQGAGSYATLNNGGLQLVGPTTTFGMVPSGTLNDGALSVTMTPASAGEILFDNFGTGGANCFTFQDSVLIEATAVKPRSFANIDLRSSNPADASRMCAWFQTTSGTELGAIWNNGNSSFNKLYIGAPFWLPNAFIQIAIGSDGTPSTAPLNFAAGTLLGAPQAGTFEYDTITKDLFFTKTATQQPFVIGAPGATAPALTALPVFTSFYGGNTNALGDPVSWLQTTIGGTVYKIPLYT